MDTIFQFFFVALSMTFTLIYFNRKYLLRACSGYSTYFVTTSRTAIKVGWNFIYFHITAKNPKKQTNKKKCLCKVCIAVECFNQSNRIDELTVNNLMSSFGWTFWGQHTFQCNGIIMYSALVSASMQLKNFQKHLFSSPLKHIKVLQTKGKKDDHHIQWLPHSLY